MKLAPAIEEFIQYKQALGSPYTTPSRVLKAFLRKTGNVEFDELTAQHAEAFLPVQGRQLRAPGFIGIRLSAVSSVTQLAVVTCNIEYFPPQSLIDHRVSFPTFIQLKISVGCWEFLIRTTRQHAPCPQTPCAR